MHEHDQATTELVMEVDLNAPNNLENLAAPDTMSRQWGKIVKTDLDDLLSMLRNQKARS